MIGKIFLGKAWHWLLLVLSSAVFWFCGTNRLHVIEFNVFVMALLAGTAFIVAIIVIFHKSGERITRDELVPTDNDDENSAGHSSD